MSGELETYQKLNLLNSYINEVKCKGRPPKWYKNFCEYLHYNDHVLMFISMNMYEYIDEAKNYLNNADAGTVNEIYFGSGFSPYGQFIG